MRLADWEAREMPVGVVDFGYLNKDRKTNGLPTVQGVLGPEVLHRAEAIVDCAGLKLYVRKGK